MVISITYTMRVTESNQEPSWL